MALGLDPVRDYDMPLERYQAGLGEYLGAVADEQWQINSLPSLWRWHQRQVADYGLGGAVARYLEYTRPGLGRAFADTLKDAGADESWFRPATPWLPKEEVQRRGKELGLSLDRGMSEAAFESIAAERRRRLENDLVFRRAREQEGYGTGRAALSVLTEFAVSLADPLNLASAFIPVTRAPLLAARLGAIESAGLRRLAAGAIEGAVGNVAVEPFTALAALDEDPQYGAVNFLLTAAFGAAIGGGLHWLGGRLAGGDVRPSADLRRSGASPSGEMARGEAAAAVGERGAPGQGDAAAAATASPAAPQGIGEAVSPAPDFGPRRANEDVAARTPQATAGLVEAASPETRDAALTMATAQLLRDRRPDVAWLFEADPRYLAAKTAYEQQTRFAREMRVSVEELHARQRLQEEEIARLKARSLDFKPPEDFVPSKAALAEARAVQAGVAPGRRVKEPESLAQFVRRAGGLDKSVPEAGDLRAADLGPLSGLLRERRQGGVKKDGSRSQFGHGADTLAQMAKEAGFYAETPDTARFLADLIDDAGGGRKTYADQDQLARWRERTEADRGFDEYVRSLGIEPRQYDERTLAYILSLDPARQRALELERAFDEGRLSEEQSLEVAARLSAEMDAAKAEGFAEARGAAADARPEGYEPELEGPLPGDYRGMSAEEFDALDRHLAELERRGIGPAEDPGRPEGARDGEGAAAAGAPPEFDPTAFAPDFSQARFRTEARIDPASLEAFARRQEDVSADLHADPDAAAKAAAYVELRSTTEIEAELAAVEAEVRPLLTEADKEALAASDARYGEERAMIDAFAACNLGGGNG